MDADNSVLTITYQLTEQDILRLIWTSLRRIRAFVILYFVLGIGFPLLGLLCLPAVYRTMDDPVRALTGMIPLIVSLPLVLFVLLPWTLRRAARRNYRSSPAARQPTTYRISADGITTSGALTASEVGWDAVVDVLETRSDFLFYLSSQAAIVIPKSALPTSEELQHLRQIIEASPCEKVTLRSSPM